MPQVDPYDEQITAFWDWFSSAEPDLYAMVETGTPVESELRHRLATIHPSLVYQMQVGELTGAKELVFSADGDRAAFDAVTQVVDRAPPLPRWKVVAFRQRLPLVYVVGSPECSIDPAEVRVMMFRDEDPERVGLLVILPDDVLSAGERAEGLTWVLLDTALGEYDMETKVGAVVIEGPSHSHAHMARPIVELPASFDSYFGR